MFKLPKLVKTRDVYLDNYGVYVRVEVMNLSEASLFNKWYSSAEKNASAFYDEWQTIVAKRIIGVFHADTDEMIDESVDLAECQHEDIILLTAGMTQPTESEMQAIQKKIGKTPKLTRTK